MAPADQATKRESEAHRNPVGLAAFGAQAMLDDSSLACLGPG